MKQFLVLLVFRLGTEYRVRHRVLCVVALGFGSSLCNVDITAHVFVSEKSAVHSLMLGYMECSGI